HNLVEELRRRAERRGRTLRIIEADLASPAELLLPDEPAVVVAPLHVVQSLDPALRAPLLGALREVIAPGTIVAVSVVDESTLLDAGLSAPGQSVPEMREIGGWVYSSEPLWLQASDAELRVRRLRQRVSPSGEMERAVHDDVLHRLSPDRLELEAEEAGYRPGGRVSVRSGPEEADSVLVLLEAA
ncbi:MAG: hypothetical protein ACRDL6_10635, partial [Solirubrobacterales bacterium]